MESKGNILAIVRGDEHSDFAPRLKRTLSLLDMRSTFAASWVELMTCLENKKLHWDVLVLDPLVKEFNFPLIQHCIDSLDEEHRPRLLWCGNTLNEIERFENESNAFGRATIDMSEYELAFIFKRIMLPENIARRTHPRALVTIDVQYSANGNQNVKGQASTFNLSAGGAFIEASSVIAKDTMLTMVLKLPDGLEPISSKSLIVHTIDHDQAVRVVHPLGMGVRFTEMDQVARSRISAYVKKNLMRAERIALDCSHY